MNCKWSSAGCLIHFKPVMVRDLLCYTPDKFNLSNLVQPNGKVLPKDSIIIKSIISCTKETICRSRIISWQVSTGIINSLQIVPFVKAKLNGISPLGRVVNNVCVFVFTFSNYIINTYFCQKKSSTIINSTIVHS